jgi:hypothetical protein
LRPQKTLFEGAGGQEIFSSGCHKKLRIVQEWQKVKARVLMANPLSSHLGSGLSFYPIADEQGELRIVSGVWEVAQKIVILLLMQKGESPLHPTMGAAPELFEPLSGEDPQAWRHTAELAVRHWIPSVENILIRFENKWAANTENREVAHITFSAVRVPGQHTLTFGWSDYTGAVWNQDPEGFRRGIELDGTPFYSSL